MLVSPPSNEAGSRTVGPAGGKIKEPIDSHSSRFWNDATSRLYVNLLVRGQAACKSRSLGHRIGSLSVFAKLRIE
jgi:hypothetical protein